MSKLVDGVWYILASMELFTQHEPLSHKYTVEAFDTSLAYSSLGEKYNASHFFVFALASSFKARISVKHFEAMKSPFKKRE